MLRDLLLVQMTKCTSAFFTTFTSARLFQVVLKVESFARNRVVLKHLFQVESWRLARTVLCTVWWESGMTMQDHQLTSWHCARFALINKQVSCRFEPIERNTSTVDACRDDGFL